MNIAVLLSGGVDSSVALWRAKELGVGNLTAFYLKIWLEDDVSYLGSCPWEEDLSYARQVCERAGVPLEVVPLQTEYFEKVVEYALGELRRGRTPSPDIFCNQRIKFGSFIDRVGGGFDLIVSGHYARTLPHPIFANEPQADSTATGDRGRVALLRAPDPVKDQTYFLSHLGQSQVARLWFPIGDMKKTEVRAKARELRLPNMDRRDSQGICFLGKIRYPEFVRHYLGEKTGEIRESGTGTVLGTHRGFWFHTIGQRTGLGLGNGPWYVVHKDPDQNIVWVSHRNELEDHKSGTVVISDLTWIAGADPASGLPTGTSGIEAFNAAGPGLTAKLRHGPDLVPVTARWGAEPASDPERRDTGADRGRTGSNSPAHPTSADGAERRGTADPNLRIELDLERPDAGAAPGQFAVLYRGEECLGAGKILDARENP